MARISSMDALTLSRALASKKVSAVEVMNATLTRIEDVNGDVNAIVSLRDHDALLAEAALRDASPRMGWLHGIPIAIKDLANVRGLPTTCGSPLFTSDIAQHDDIVVARLRAAGAIIVGKTNTPEFGLGSHTVNPVHGATCNPYDLTKSAGGSSGGAAAALATGMVCIADGSDMMGSLRNPAGWNNVYGMRPSWGLVPSEPEGDIFLHQLSTNGPMARSPADLAAMLDTMSGCDPRQPHGYDAPPTLAQINTAINPPRVGWLGNWSDAFPFDDGIFAISEAAMFEMEEMGWRVDSLTAPFDADAMWDAWITLRSFSIAADLGGFYDDPTKRDQLNASAQWEVTRGQSMGAMRVQRASLVRSDWFRAAARLFDHFDVLALPSAQVWPFPIGKEYPGEIASLAMDTYHRWMQVTVPAALIGVPVVNIPIGFGAHGLPAGVQLIGKRGSDAHLLKIAQLWHRQTEWPQKHPAMTA
ncbi:MAG: amidase [Sulfitobacter sp.]